MFDTCDTCETEDTGVMWVNGLTLCYECATLTTLDTETETELDTEEEAL